MAIILGNKEEIDFVIHQYPAVMAVVEALAITKKDFPIWLTKRIAERCKRTEKLTDARNFEWTLEHYDDQVCVYPPDEYHSEEKELGLYYGFENINWEALVTDESGDEGPWIYLYYDMPDKRRRDWVIWEEKISKALLKEKKNLIKKGYSVLPDKDDKQYLLKLYISEVLNLNNVQTNVDRMIDEIIKMLVKTISDSQKLLITIPQ